ncbi:hypothetical protein WHI96_21300 [Pseudonocardia tropica]|uniref:Uncharacterized protein n=1 Tax=Pseudonocardia tropica TaxID=681289 RepID=A0ABV1JZG7_9PSEU
MVGLVLFAGVAIVVLPRLAADEDGVVGTDGLTLEIGGIRITAPPGVAPEGTRLNARIADAAPSVGAGAVPGPVGAGITLDLDGGLQPARPVSITFPSTETYSVRTPAEVTQPDDRAPFVLTQPSDGSPPELLPARWDPVARTVSVDVTHFSSFWEKLTTARRMMEQAVGELNGSTARPDCAGRDVELGDGGRLTIDGPAGGSAWACLRADDRHYYVDLTNNSPEPWDMRAAPDAVLQPQRPTGVADSVAIRLAELTWAGRSGAPGVLPTGGTASYAFPLGSAPGTVRLTADPGTLLVSQTLFAVDVVASVFGVTMLQRMLELPEAVDCLSSVAEATGSRGLDPAAAARVVRATLDCIGPFMARMGMDSPVVAVITAILGSGIGLIVAGVAAIVDTVAGPFRIVVRSSGRPTVITDLAPVDGSGRPADGWTVRDEGAAIDCGYTSPAGRDPGVQTCGPAAAAADACWAEPGGTTALCLRSAFDTVLYRHPASNLSSPRPSGVPVSPLSLELDDGTRCELRNGGSWPGRADDETLYGAYSCSPDDSTVVWGSPKGDIARTTDRWAVQIGGTTGPLRTRGVRQAWYVRTG